MLLAMWFRRRPEPFERFERPTAEGRALCEDLKQEYKVEHIDDDLKKYPTLSFYRQGEFIDLCRGPHIPNAGKVGAENPSAPTCLRLTRAPAAHTCALPARSRC